MAINSKNDSVLFSVSTRIYSKDIIYKACYVFIDKMYIFLDISDKKDAILVTLRGKAPLLKNELEKLKGEFMNELLNSLIRENVSKRNQKILEQIVGGAMGAALGIQKRAEASEKENDDNLKDDEDIEAAVAALRKELDAIEIEDDYEADALGIRNIAMEETNVGKAALSPSLGKQNNKKKNNGKKK